MNDNKYRPLRGDVFHVHTYRCGHAGNNPDRAYVEKAIELGAERIVFTDHAPFPGNPFGNRMDIEQLPEYAGSMKALKEEYKNRIEVLAGLEAEYLPSFIDYLHELKNDHGLDLLILGQHFYEHEPGNYSFSDEDKSDEFLGLCDAMIRGIRTHLFDVVAHPDRAFRRRKIFAKEEISAARALIREALYEGVFLEVNYSSVHRKHQFWPEFWNLLETRDLMIYGLDAHSVEELEEGMKEYGKYMV